MIETPISDWSVVVALLFGTTFGVLGLVYGVIKLQLSLVSKGEKDD